MTASTMNGLTPAASRTNLARPAGLMRRLGLMLEARRTRRLLAEMDHHLLADIGIGLGDAQMEACRPFWDLGPPR